jgi:MarR family transcriptional regulator, lower aerobic nicotinate degradation pathway regulator
MPSSRRRSPTVELNDQPGFHIRRLQQIAVAVFLQETEGQGITPVQYAALQTVADQPGIDQRTLAGAIAFDTSTIAGVLDRLEARGWLARTVDPEDKRVRRLALTAEGDALLAATVPGMRRAQERILAPLRNKAERAEFLRMLRVLVHANNEHSRAPHEAVA